MVIESIMCNLPNFSNNSLGAISFICTKSGRLFEGGDCFECFRLGGGGWGWGGSDFRRDDY